VDIHNSLLPYINEILAVYSSTEKIYSQQTLKGSDGEE
jgi:hypothetical protein